MKGTGVLVDPSKINKPLQQMHLALNKEDLEAYVRKLMMLRQELGLGSIEISSFDQFEAGESFPEDVRNLLKQFQYEALNHIGQAISPYLDFQAAGGNFRIAATAAIERYFLSICMENREFKVKDLKVNVDESEAVRRLKVAIAILKIHQIWDSNYFASYWRNQYPSNVEFIMANLEPGLNTAQFAANIAHQAMSKVMNLNPLPESDQIMFKTSMFKLIAALSKQDLKHVDKLLQRIANDLDTPDFVARYLLPPTEGKNYWSFKPVEYEDGYCFNPDINVGDLGQYHLGCPFRGNRNLIFMYVSFLVSNFNTQQAEV